MTPESAAALALLRDPSAFHWSAITLLGVVLYAYAETARRGDWSAVILGISFTAGELVWEIGNALVLYTTDVAPLWLARGGTSYLMLVGLTVEIYLMFALAPLVLFALLPADREARLVGLRLRLAIPIGLGLFCVAVEATLNQLGVLVWTWWFWRFPMLPLVAVAYCAPFCVLAWARYTFERRAQLASLGLTVAGALLSWLVFVSWLGWA